MYLLLEFEGPVTKTEKKTDIGLDLKQSQCDHKVVQLSVMTGLLLHNNISKDIEKQPKNDDFIDFLNFFTCIFKMCCFIYIYMVIFDNI